MNGTERSLMSTAKRYAKKRGKKKAGKSTLMPRGSTGLSSYSDDDRTPPSTTMIGKTKKPTGT